jgi:hypothetical protein
MVMGADSNQSDPPAGKDQPGASVPYVFVTTSLPTVGVPVVGADGVLHVFATGLGAAENRHVAMMVDGVAIEEAHHVEHDGSLRMRMTVPEDMAYGEHRVEILHTVEGKEVRLGRSFVKAAIDEVGETRGRGAREAGDSDVDPSQTP